MSYFALLFTLLISLIQVSTFKETQLRYARVKAAHQQKGKAVSELLAKQGLSPTSLRLFIRAFKKEQLVEVWASDSQRHTFELLVTYPFCTTSGVLGPKRKEGDLQIPEGIYHINHFNPQSNFYLSLGINYPNAADQLLGDPKYPGGSIYIHGDCVTIGCIPITDDKIKELYLLVIEAKNSGQEKIQVHIFPAKLKEGVPEVLAQAQPAHFGFWKNLQTIYQDFEVTKSLRKSQISATGEYTFSN